MITINKITTEGISGQQQDAGLYQVLNPQVYGIDDWEYFRNELFSSGTGDQSKPISRANAFKGYESAGRAAAGDNEPRYGLTYLQDVKADPDLSLARKVIQAAKSSDVPLIMFFGQKYENHAYPSNECLPFFGLRFDNVPVGPNETAAEEAFQQFISSEFPGLSVYHNGIFLAVSIVGYYGGKTFNAYEHHSPPPEAACNGFAKNSTWEPADVLNKIAPRYARRLELEQSQDQLKFLTKYEAFVESKLSGVNLSKVLDSVYNGASDSGKTGATMHIRPDSELHDVYRYGTWYGTGRNGQKWAQPPDDQIRDIHQQCDEHCIPLVVLQSNLYGGCNICNSLFIAWINPPQFRNWLVKSPYIFFVDGTWNKSNKVARYIKDKLGLDLGDSVSLGIYWKRPDGSILRATHNSDYYNGFQPLWIYPSWMTTAVRRAAYEDQVHYAVDWALKDYERDSAFENDTCLLYLQEQPDDHGGNIDNEILDVSDNFITGQWYLYRDQTQNLQKFIDYATQSKKTVIILGSSFGCVNCSDFKTEILDRPEMKNWLAESGCLLLHGYSGSGWWTSQELKLFLSTFNKGLGSSLPMIRVWKSGQILWQGTYTSGVHPYTWYIEEFSKYITEHGDGNNDIKLFSGKNKCTSQTDPDVTDDDNIGLNLIHNTLQRRGYPNDQNGYIFSGWSSIEGVNGAAYGDKGAFASIKKLSEANGRPIFAIYGKARNKGSCALNQSLNYWRRAVPQGITNFGKCQVGQFKTLRTGEFGFYFIDYMNDEDETCAEANEVKQFITQFGSIPTGYPWYIAYCKRADGSVYARYGSLHSSNVLVGNNKNNDKIISLYEDNMKMIRSIGQEIQYIWGKNGSNQHMKLDAFDDVLRLSEANGRPILAFYGRAGNGGINDFNSVFFANSVLRQTILITSACQKDSFNPDGGEDGLAVNCGFYFVYYCNDRNETVEEANKVKQFITQFGPITTGYPWYIAYCKRADGSVYARYGSWSATKAEKTNDQYFNLWKQYFSRIVQFGKEIQYVWTGDSIDTKFIVSFDLNGGIGYLNPIEVSKPSTTIILPSESKVKASVSLSGFKAVKFQNERTGAFYSFGEDITVNENLTLIIIWEKDDGSDDSDSGNGKREPPIGIHGKTNSYYQNQFPIYHQYVSDGEKFARMSGNLSALGIVGPLMSKNLATGQLVDVTLNPKIVEISPSCFAECKNLANVDAGNRIKSVGDYAFYKCENLSGVSFLASDNKVLTRIGDYAFAGSGLKSIQLNLQGSVVDSSINTHCFADCKQLTSVEMVNSTYLGDHMFDGCDKLTNVKLNNYHSYVNPYAFANCRTLAKIQIPSNIYMLSPHMFEGCMNLTSIEFQSDSQLRQLGECVFSGCTRLTSIVLPPSINNLDYIDSRFLSGSNVQRLEFKGLSDDVFINEVYSKISVDYATHRWYSSPKSIIEGLMNTCHEKHLPMIVNLGNAAENCIRCKTWEENVVDQASWKTWFKDSPYFYVHAQYGVDEAAYYAAHTFIAKAHLAVPGQFPRIYLYWNKLNGDGTESLVALGGDGVNDSTFNNATSLIAKAEEVFDGYEGLSSYSYELKNSITTFGLGTGKKIIYVSSTGKEYECGNDSVSYTPEVKVDKLTKSNFKFGMWYGNARELVAAANASGVPVLAEFGSIGCDPCIDFRKNTFNNKDFQSKITSLPVFLCKVEIGEGESFDYPPTSQANWISHSFGDPKTYIPQLIFYWKPPATISTASPYKEIWNYNYRTDAANANYQTVLNKVDAMLNHFTGGREWLASISSSFESKTIYNGENGKYIYYENEPDDYDGHYFICDSKTRIQTWNSADLSIENEGELVPYLPLNELYEAVDPKIQDLQILLDDAMEPTSYIKSGAYSIFSSISENDIVEIAKATYQYFTTSPRISNPNLSGIIFKVSEMSAVNNKVVKYENEQWKYLDDSLVELSDIEDISLKNGVEYLYEFFNENASIPDSPKDDDWPVGTWIKATEITSKDAFDDICIDSESNSTVLVIVEDLRTSTAIATLEDGSTSSIKVNLDGVQIDNVEKTVKDSFKDAGKTVLSIGNLDSLKATASFKTMISDDVDFKRWMKETGYRFLLVKTDDWSRGFPQAVRQFEEEVAFEGNTPSDGLPKILVYHGCSTCVISGIALYCRKKIAVDQIRTDSSYYRGLIDSYAAQTDSYIWYR